VRWRLWPIGLGVSAKLAGTEERACVPQAIVVDPKVSPSQKRHVDKPAIYTVD